MSIQLGNHVFRKFDGLDAAFGARMSDYPKYDDIPKQFRDGYTPHNKAVSALFFKGGKLADHGLKLKSSVDSSEFYGTLKSLLCSFDPPHEHKDAACAWLLAECTEPA